MRDIRYNLLEFHKAVKRNKPSVVYCDWFEFWFCTQKAIISYSSESKKLDGHLVCWLNEQNIEVHYVE